MEQRIPSSASATHTNSPSSRSVPPRVTSATNLRNYRGASGGGHSRRPSMDIPSRIGESSTGTSPSPITYFPPPSAFTTSMPTHRSSSRPSTSPSGRTRPAPRRSSTSPSPPPLDDDDDGDRDHIGDRTPRALAMGLTSSESSPRTRRNNSMISMPTSGFGDARRASRSSTLPAGAPDRLDGLGLGLPGSTRKGRADDALASPRRISTSRPTLPTTAHPPTLNTEQSLLLPSLPTNEAYYSQPPTATTPRFRRSAHQHTGSYGAIQDGRQFVQGHSRRLSAHSLAPSFLAPPSPASSVFRKLRKTASSIGISLGGAERYDAEEQPRDDEEEGRDEDSKISNGTRVWYSSYATIDWIHDAIKESSRVRRLRALSKRSRRGAIANTWDRLQGWLVVTMVGILAAAIAFLIIRTEMALFDLKEGFCRTSWGTAKRFCCAPHHRGPTGPGSDPEQCGDWVEWGEAFGGHRGRDREEREEWVYGWAEWTIYGIVALALACTASCLTIFLSSSAHHTTSKDSTFLVPSPMHETHSRPKSPPRTPVSMDTPRLAPPDEKILEKPRKIMYYAAGSGIPEIKTILSGFVIHGYLGGWTLLTKSIGLALSVASGLSLGKEGPLVHISCCVGNIVSRLFTKFETNEAKRREILSAACAAGVSVAFGAPVGGVLFSLEEVSYYFPPKVMWRSFWCAAVAAITLKGLNPFGNGSIVLFAVTYTKQYRYWEFSIFILLGVFGGLYGALFSRLNILWSRHVRGGTWVGKYPIIEVLAVTALTTTLSFVHPYTRMGGTELIASLFAECKPNSSNPFCVDHPIEMAGVIYDIAITLLIKGGLTIITFGIKLPAGIFIPSLVVGACFGRIVGMSFEYLQWVYPGWDVFELCEGSRECVVPGIYAMVGAAATLAGVTRTTISLVVIVLELTSSLNYVVPIMLAVLVAKTVADGLEKKGIYDLVIEFNQLPYLDSKHEYLWGGRRVSEIAEANVPILRADKTHTVRSLTGRLLELARMGMADSGFPVLAKDDSDLVRQRDKERDRDRHGGERMLRVVGFLGMNELEHALSELADEPDSILNLMPDDSSSRGHQPRSSVLSIFSFADSVNEGRHNPYDLSQYIDRAPVIVQMHSPLELVQQLFVKLGARQLLVVDTKGVFRGLVTKKSWLNLLSEMEEEERAPR